jgi:hypothetical protein
MRSGAPRAPTRVCIPGSEPVFGQKQYVPGKAGRERWPEQELWVETCIICALAYVRGLYKMLGRTEANGSAAAARIWCPADYRC